MARYAELSAGPFDDTYRPSGQSRVPHGGPDVVRRCRDWPGRRVAVPESNRLPDPDGRAAVAADNFGAKLAALLLFAGLFVVGTHVALAPLAAMTMLGMFRTGSFAITMASFGISSALASLFAALAIVGVHGLLVLFAPRARPVAFSGAVRSATIGGLLLSLPLVVRLPAADRAFATDAGGSGWPRRRGSSDWSAGSPAIPFSPRLLLSPRSRRWGFWSSRWSATCCCTAVFDRVTLQPAPSRRADASDRSLARWSGRAPYGTPSAASSPSRSPQPLAPGPGCGAVAAAGGFVLNSLLNASGWHDGIRRGRSRRRSPRFCGWR